NNRTLKARSPDAPSAKGLVAFRNEAEATRQPPPKLPWEAICAHEASILGSVPKVGVSIRFWRAGEACPRKTDIV
ncbi:MAG: hypothetical protein E7J25_13600, partial [Paeniclostridium sordellii]|nr:hypothetical protein [Paeniclostridium sordellii]